MGTVFNRFAGYGFWCNDGFMEIWLALLADAVLDEHRREPWLAEAASEWRTYATHGVSGIFHANLDQHAIVRTASTN